jgi:FtsH-binding integral membrane protein
MNKNIIPSAILLLVLSMGLTSCEAIGDLIEFGVWIGVIIVVAVLALVFWIYRKFKR